MNKQEILIKLVQASPMLAAIGEELSFTKAAERLKVDQSAVSHRTKALEQSLGHTLFDRTTRQLRLTEIGKIVCQAARDSMNQWDIALDSLERSHSSNQIHLSIPSSLAMKWLIAVLPNAKENNLNLSVDVKEETVNFHNDEADAAIRFGVGPYPGLYALRLADCFLQPVASPAYLASRPSGLTLLSDPETVLLSDRRGETDKTDFSWQHYLTQTQASNQELNSDYQFDRADLMLQAAISGLGVGLGRTLLVEEDIAAGYLVPVGQPVRMRAGYWLVCSASFAETERYLRLHSWLKSEIKNTTRKLAACSSKG